MFHVNRYGSFACFLASLTHIGTLLKLEANYPINYEGHLSFSCSSSAQSFYLDLQSYTPIQLNQLAYRWSVNCDDVERKSGLLEASKKRDYLASARERIGIDLGICQQKKYCSIQVLLRRLLL